MPEETTTSQQSAGETEPETHNTETATGPATNQEKTFTQEDVNRIAGEARKTARAAAVNELLKEIGLESQDALTDLVNDAKTRREADMTELQKATERIGELEPLQEQTQTLNNQLESANQALQTYLDALEAELNIPEHVKPLLENMNKPERLDYLSKNKDAFARTTPPNTNAGGKGGKPPQTAQEIEQKREKLRAKYGIR